MLTSNTTDSVVVAQGDMVTVFFEKIVQVGASAGYPSTMLLE